MRHMLMSAVRHALNLVPNKKMKGCPGGYKDTYDLAAALDAVAEADLWYIASDAEGENHDLFVLATSQEEAEKKWMAYYELDPDEPYKVRVQNVSQSVFDAAGVVQWNLREGIV